MPGLRVDLGSTPGRWKKLPGFDVYVDLLSDRENPKHSTQDLREKWAFKTNAVEFFRAHDIIEHLPDKIHTMNEIHRCLKDRGLVEIFVPTDDGAGANCDPTHVSWWNRQSFIYHTVGIAEFEQFKEGMGIRGGFLVDDESVQEFKYTYSSGDIIVKKLMITLCAVKS